ncbi:hypothetical protein [Levilactobacillus tujiorum]|uniref:hypothetical protein n=1 Tax=Levilactobacillus tujiorum TaxID=2912243 RepID=UPI001456D3BF|nr:hypothetical protein [Levilactobacillus tujiorum]NLR31918.1 hypothetical protein [Levilactobacillus tujiorum]
MGIGKFLTGVTLATGVGLAAYFTLTKQDPRTWAKHISQQAQTTVDQVDDIKVAKDRLADKAQALNTAVTAATPVIDDIQSQVEKFAFKVAPRVDIIEETVSRWDNL